MVIRLLFGFGLWVLLCTGVDLLPMEGVPSSELTSSSGPFHSGPADAPILGALRSIKTDLEKRAGGIMENMTRSDGGSYGGSSGGSYGGSSGGSYGGSSGGSYGGSSGGSYGGSSGGSYGGSSGGSSYGGSSAHWPICRYFWHKVKKFMEVFSKCNFIY
ncbi:hypothetical protein ACLKA7_010292 [Drosophila subpalustris]